MSPPTPQIWADRIRDAALALGFSRVGFSPIEPMARGEQALKSWLEQGYHGTMAYLQTTPSAQRHHPGQLLHEAQSAVVVALSYHRQSDETQTHGATDAVSSVNQGNDVPRGRIARYAHGPDYHHVLKHKLHQLAEACERIVGRPVVHRACVDTAPLLERELAHRAGVAFIAKSTMAIVPGVGTYVLLGELLLDVPLEPSTPAVSKCGQCTACLSACPTGAFVGPYVLDARRCIAYLTIELQGPIPRHLRSMIGNMVFGCDICQQVCPFNKTRSAPPPSSDMPPRPELAAPSLVELLQLSSASYRKWVKGSAMRRINRPQLARNAAIALGNSGDRRVVPHLAHALRTSIYPLVRGHAAWALGQLGGEDALDALHAASTSDTDPWVLEEIAAARTTLCTIV